MASGRVASLSNIKIVPEIVLITGASSGIGYRTAQLAASRGHQVIATAMTAALLRDVPDTAALKLIIDICDEESILKAVADAEQSLGPVTCLINNAGYCQPGPVELVDAERLRRQFEVNVFGTMAMTRAILPRFRAAGAGRVITLSSMLGRVAMPYQGVYCASKYALEALCDALRIEVKRFGIDVVLIEPGWISTAFLKTATSLTPREWLADDAYGLQLTRYFELSAAAEGLAPRGMHKVIASLAGTPEDVAATVVRAIEAKRPDVRYTVTALAKWLPRLARWMPTRIWDDIQASQIKAD